MKKRQGTAPPHKKPGKDTPGQRVLLSQVIDFLPDPTFAIDRAGTVTVWNRAMEEMTGVKAKDMVGKGDCEYAIPFYGERRPILIDLVLHPDPERERAYSSLVRQGDSLYAETIGLPSRRFLWAKASPIRNRRGTITGAIESIRDVTDHKHIEETVVRSEARYRDIFENVSDYLYLHDLDGVFIETNFANKRESGYSEAELNNLSIRDLLPDRHRHRFQNYMKNVVDKGSDEGFLTIVFKDGQERVLEYRNSLITDNQGWPVAVRGSARDITARLRAQKELKKERDFITAIIQTSPAFYVAMDPAGRIVLMNEAMLASLNYGLKAVLGRDFVTTLVHPNDQAFITQGISELTSSSRSTVLTLRMISRDGRDVLVRWHYKPVHKADGGIDFIFGMGIDITGQKRAEELSRISEKKFQAAFHSSADPMAIIDPPTGSIIDVNTAFVTWSGYEAEEAIGRTTMDLDIWQDPLDRDRYIGRLRLGETVYREEVRLRDRTGARHIVILSAAKVEVEGASYLFLTLHDITDLRNAQTRLSKSERHYRLLAENASDVIWVLNLDLTYRFVSPSVENLRGYTVNEVLGQTLRDVLTPESYRNAMELMRRERLREDSGHRHGPQWSTTAEFEMTRKDGSTVWTEARLSVLYDDTGQVSGILGITRDISERRRTEEVLQQTRFAVDHLAEEAYWINRDGRFIYVNEASCRALGYSREELLAMGVQDIDPLFQQDRWPRHWQELKESGSLVFESIHRRKDGTEFPVEVQTNFLEYGGQEFNWAFARDITERKHADAKLRESEERFRRMAEASPEVFWMTSPDWSRVIYVSPAFEKIFGLRAEELVQNPSAGISLIHDQDRDAVISFFRRSQDPDAVYEFRIVRPDGTLRWIRNRRSTVLDEQGSAILLVGIAEDITDRVQSEEERKVYEARLARAQKLEAIGTLAGGIAHDFNNILSAIIGYSELAQEELPASNPAHASLQEVIRAGDRAKDLVKQILTFSRQMETERKPVRVQLIVKEVMKLLRSSIPKTITIRDSIEPSAGPVFADPTQIHQVIMNLCTNAYHAMLPAGGELTISVDSVFLDARFASLHPELREGTYLRLAVQDTGIGMDPETMKRIFDPFFTTKEKTKGTGLGLATVHGIVTDLGGSVLVTSTVGRGSTFEIYLPVSKKLEEEDEEPDEELGKGRGQTILLVDDEEAILHFTGTMLEQLGYLVIRTSSSLEALGMFRSNPQGVDLVITDQTMPGLTGAALASEVLRTRPGTPVILMTGYSETITPEEALAQGIEEYIEKPFTRSALARAVHRCLLERNRA